MRVRIFDISYITSNKLPAPDTARAAYLSFPGDCAAPGILKL